MRVIAIRRSARCDDYNIPVRHDSIASLRGFLIVTADEARARSVEPAGPLSGLCGSRAHTSVQHMGRARALASLASSGAPTRKFASTRAE